MELRIYSGGQTGVDQAAWRAARMCGLVTGGWMPLHFRTESPNGQGWGECHPEFEKMYGAREHSSPDYPPRMRVNVEAAHANLIGSDREELEGGTKKTYEHAYTMGQRGAGLFIAVPPLVPVRDCADWIRECIDHLGMNQHRFILNIAGPRESKCPGIGKRAENYLTEVFQRLGHGWDF